MRPATTRAPTTSSSPTHAGPRGREHRRLADDRQRHASARPAAASSPRPGEVLDQVAQLRRHAGDHDHRHRLQSAGSSIFNTATVTGNVKNQGVTQHGVRGDDGPAAVRPDDHQGRQPRPGLRALVAAGRAMHLAPGISPSPPGFPARVRHADRRSLAPPGLPRRPHATTSSSATAASARRPASSCATRCPPGLIFDSYRTDGGLRLRASTRRTSSPAPAASIPAASTRTIKFLLVAPPTVGLDHEHRHGRPEQRDLRGRRDEQHRDAVDDISTGIDLVVWKGDEATARRPARRRTAADGRLRPDRHERHRDLHDHRRQRRHPGLDRDQGARHAARRDEVPVGDRPTTASPARTTALPPAAT